MGEVAAEEQRRALHRQLAMEANNRAWALSEKPGLTNQDHATLLDAAHAAAYHWRAIGTPEQVGHADLLLGRVHALLGHGALAMTFATAAFQSITSRDCARWEAAFAHAILAHAAAVAGDTREHARSYAEAKSLGAQLDGEDEKLFRATFTLIPAPR